MEPPDPERHHFPSVITVDFALFSQATNATYGSCLTTLVVAKAAPWAWGKEFASCACTTTPVNSIQPILNAKLVWAGLCPEANEHAAAVSATVR